MGRQHSLCYLTMVGAVVGGVLLSGTSAEAKSKRCGPGGGTGLFAHAKAPSFKLPGHGHGHGKGHGNGGLFGGGRTPGANGVMRSPGLGLLFPPLLLFRGAGAGVGAPGLPGAGLMGGATAPSLPAMGGAANMPFGSGGMMPADAPLDSFDITLTVEPVVPAAPGFEAPGVPAAPAVPAAPSVEIPPPPAVTAPPAIPPSPSLPQS